ncbi:arylsulfatase [Fodinibius sp.]|uniref:arylsulfatase n=1 Tax=Fodinibius sp. TaxID=1872440 RepID=UPI0035620EC9
MKNIYAIVLCLTVLTAGCNSAAAQTKSDLPNIVYILADDLGYGELGVYGQEKIETPNIDALARNGMTFTQHYSGSPVCAPSRYMLLTGKHPGHAYIRSNGDRELPEGVSLDDYENRFEAMFEHPEIEGQIALPSSTVTIAEVLKEAGYQTGAAGGKWGNGGPNSEGHPNNQGFDFFYGYLCQRQAHTYYPTHLWRNNERILLDNELVNPHQDLPEDSDPYDPESYSRFHDQPDYSAEVMLDETLGFIDDNHSNPFFLFIPSTIPHVSLQAPKRWIDYYLEKFGDEEPYTEGSYVPVRYPNATYAAMISYLDEQVGAIVEKLKERGIYENTLIMFSSDNGPTTGGGVNPEYFNSAGPFLNFKNNQSRVKGHLFEGGIRVPMIATWEGVIPAGSTTDHISAFWDVLPTLSEIAGVDPPEEIDGISFLPTLMGEDSNQEKHDYLYWEFPSYGGQQAVRMNRWKGIRKDIMADGNLEIELYNLEEDIREENNVADQHPEVVDSIRTIMEREHSVPKLKHFQMEALGN